MRYFQQFPIITYNSKRVRDITKRVKVLETVKNYATLYYNYTIKDGERPDTIAFNYYGNSYYFWVIYLVNNIVDPYYDWPMTQIELETLIATKYGSISEAQALILYYEKIKTNWYVSKQDLTTTISEDDWLTLSSGEKDQYSLIQSQEVIKISTVTFDGLSGEDQDDYLPVYAYDHEFVVNESKRKIKLLDLRYLPVIERDFIEKMKA